MRLPRLLNVQTRAATRKNKLWKPVSISRVKMRSSFASGLPFRTILVNIKECCAVAFMEIHLMFLKKFLVRLTTSVRNPFSFIRVVSIQILLYKWRRSITQQAYLTIYYTFFLVIVRERIMRYVIWEKVYSLIFFQDYHYSCILHWTLHRKAQRMRYSR